MFKFVLFVSLQLSYVTCDSCKRVDELVSRRVVSLQVSYLGRYDSFSPCNAPSLANLSVYNYRKSRVSQHTILVVSILQRLRPLTQFTTIVSRSIAVGVTYLLMDFCAGRRVCLLGYRGKQVFVGKFHSCFNVILFVRFNSI